MEPDPCGEQNRRASSGGEQRADGRFARMLRGQHDYLRDDHDRRRAEKHLPPLVDRDDR
jgi:hypothetical protein